MLGEEEEKNSFSSFLPPLFPPFARAILSQRGKKESKEMTEEETQKYAIKTRGVRGKGEREMALLFFS